MASDNHIAQPSRQKMRAKFIDLTGQRFERLVVINRVIDNRTTRGTRWQCQCDCGQTPVVAGKSLRDGSTRSCGCYKREVPQRKTHGKSRNENYRSAYRTWVSMKGRCNNVRDDHYHLYGGRGIRVCEKWNSSFDAFIEDMGPRPSLKHSVERKNNNGNYEPTNCVWATQKEQMRNMRRNVFLEHNGKRLTVVEWSEITGIRPTTIFGRIKWGWTVPEILETPPLRRPNRK